MKPGMHTASFCILLEPTILMIMSNIMIITHLIISIRQHKTTQVIFTAQNTEQHSIFLYHAMP